MVPQRSRLAVARHTLRVPSLQTLPRGCWPVLGPYEQRKESVSRASGVQGTVGEVSDGGGQL